jgi:hypothetical protein
MSSTLHRKRRRANRLHRRGSALVMVLLMTVALAALALSAIFMTSGGSMLTRHYDREREFRYAAEAALAMGKSRLHTDTSLVLPDTGYVTLLSNAQIMGADGQELPGVRVNLYAGRTGSTTGQFGLYASLVAEARDNSGARYVRRLELAEENFARFLGFTNQNQATPGYFAKGHVFVGPMWSNDIVYIADWAPHIGAEFRDDLGTARTITGKTGGIYFKGYRENQPRIELPSMARLARLAAYGAAGNASFNAPTIGNETTARMRIELVWVDLNGDGMADEDEGFFRVYEANAGQNRWLRGEYNAANRPRNCGVFIPSGPAAEPRFYPHAGTAFNTALPGAWARALWVAAGMTPAQADAMSARTFDQVMALPTARCFLGGDPHLAGVERTGAAAAVAGSDTTFTANGQYGRWLPYPGAVAPEVLLARPHDAGFLFPIHRRLNPGFKGVIHVNGTVGLSGRTVGRLTVYSTGTMVALDDTQYGNHPALNTCRDILGRIAGADVVIADNALNTPQNVPGAGWKQLGGRTSLTTHAVSMALGIIRAENHGSGPTNAVWCVDKWWGRGCHWVVGGAITNTMGFSGTFSGHGFITKGDYDRCMDKHHPPYFPTTGRFLDNRYYEIDPVRFDVAQLFDALRPSE